ncbi:MAG: hypothetical protein JZU55_16270 [Afipia sp.]|nr:hypothetical protein [Afipia sp.]
MLAHDETRTRFEAAVVERLKESGFLEIQIRTECLARVDDGYQDEVINAGWHYWQAAFAAVIAEAKEFAVYSSPIERFSMTFDGEEGWIMLGDPDGEYVRYADVAAWENPKSKELVTHIRAARDGDTVCYAWQVCASADPGAIPVYHVDPASTPSVPSTGWLYDNEDTGREYSVDHPIESGTVPDATNIVPATADTLLTELKSAWQAWNEDREELARTRAALFMPSPQWLPIAKADRSITQVQEFPSAGITLRNSDRYWVRDDLGGRAYEASWSEGRNGQSYWWAWEAESPVNPSEFMPHPLDPRYREKDSDRDQDIENCPVCDEPMKPFDILATDIELGACHAECLKDSPVVDLDTGEETGGEITTFRRGDRDNG